MPQSLPSKTNCLQTASNVAATVTAALVQGGVISTVDDAKSTFNDMRDEVFESLQTELQAEELTSGGSGGSNGRGRNNDPLRMSSGKYAGQTYVDIVAKDRDYAEWYVKNGPAQAHETKQALAALL